MAAYDPKRPRPSAGTPADDPAPVEALLDPGTVDAAAPAESDEATPVGGEEAKAEPAATASAAAGSETGGEAEQEPASSDPEPRTEPEPPTTTPEPAGVALNGSGASSARSASPRTPSEVPVAAAPATGTANRAVLIAAAVSSIVGFLVLAVLVRRRRR